MPQIDIENLGYVRRRTRTYDADNSNTPTVIQAIIASLVPAGSYMPTALSANPEGDAWKLCNGQSLIKEDYPRLYGIFGSRFGETATTFNLPNLANRVPIGAGSIVPLFGTVGAETVTLTQANMPDYELPVTDPEHDHGVTDPEHMHAITDPEHTHTSANAAGAADSATGTDTTSAVNGSTGSSATGISIESAATGVSVDAAPTGITVQSGGEDEAFSVVQPGFGVNWLVKT